MATAHHRIWHTIIIGAGAGGLMCAGSFGANKLVVEHNAVAGRKLNITGGGKCNFTNLYLTPADYECEAKHFAHKALTSFSPKEFIHLLQSSHIYFEEKENGCLFAHKAQDITRFLFRRAKENNTEFAFGVEALKISRDHDLFRLDTSQGPLYANNLVIASGGVSYPSLGATNFAWKAAKELGLHTIAPRPVLAGLRLPSPWRDKFRTLAGNSIYAKITCGKRTETGNLLFTHDGISGPAVLQLSLYWQEGEKLRINFLPETDVQTYLRIHKNEPAVFSKILSELIAPKISKVLLGNNNARSSDASRGMLLEAARTLNAFEIIPSGSAGYTRAEATAGGIDTAELCPTTMECKKIAGLFFIGECTDVTGRVGGYNLHWAWASAWAAAKTLAIR